ncbi:MAG: phosphoribosylglycinamide formyltransferase [Candidatus Aminicenantes bacterium]|nr:phosphoribosylglycinamide formyltransferase [Candidatus Aminicenantes bacterium]
MNKGRVAVLLSGRGSNFTAMVRDSRRAGANFSIRLVISDQQNAPGLRKAAASGIPNYCLARENFSDREAHERAICALLEQEGIELVCLAGYMRLVGPVLLDKFSGRIMNIHPSLLPACPGLHAQRQALRLGLRVSGCTVHFVDAGLDSGPIIVQQAVRVREDDSEETLSRRILRQEHRLFPRAIRLFFAGRLQIRGRTVIIMGA